MAPHPIPLPCALAFPPPSHRDATTPSPCWAPHFMTQERIMFSNPTPSEPCLSPAATMSDVTPSALSASLHCTRAFVKMAFMVARISVPKYPCVHPFQKRPLRASVFKSLKTNIWIRTSETLVFTTGFLKRPGATLRARGGPYSGAPRGRSASGRGA